MRLLLDTNILLWMLKSDARLSAKSKAVLDDHDGPILVSVVSLAEMHIKKRIGKLEIPDGIEAEVEAIGLSWLHLRPPHLSHLSTLPLHHRDPFDRMIISQAVAERLQVLTSDDDFELYPIRVIRN